MENKYKYYAFISYKREDKDPRFKEDEKWANAIYHYLRAWDIPVVIQKEPSRLVRQNDKKIDPVFLDKTIMNGAGTVDNQLKSHLKVSKCLVVVCSRNMIEDERKRESNGETAFVFNEIRDFLSSGNEIDNTLRERVFLVWIDEIGFDPGRDVPPPFDSSKKVINVNEYRKSKEKGHLEQRVVSEIAASVFNANRDLFWDSYLRQQKKRKRTIISLIAIFIIIVTALGLILLTRLSTNQLDKAKTSLLDGRRKEAAEYALNSYHFWPFTHGLTSVMWDCLNPNKPWMVFNSEFAANPSAYEIAVISGNRELQVYDSQTYKLKEAYKINGGESLLFSPDGQIIAVYSRYYNADLTICDRNKHSTYSRFISHSTNEIPVFNGDGSIVYYGGECYSSQLDSVICSRFTGDGWAESASFMGTNSLLAIIRKTGSWDEQHLGSLTLYDLNNLSVVQYSSPSSPRFKAEPVYTFEFPKNTSYASFFADSPSLFYVEEDSIHYLEFDLSKGSVIIKTSGRKHHNTRNWISDYYGDRYLFAEDEQLGDYLQEVNSETVKFIAQKSPNDVLAYTNLSEIVTHDGYGNVSVVNSSFGNRKLPGISLGSEHQQIGDRRGYRCVRLYNGGLIFEIVTNKTVGRIAKSYLYTEEDLRNEVQLRNGFNCEYVSPQASFLLGSQGKEDGLVNLSRESFMPFTNLSFTWDYYLNHSIAYLSPNEQTLGILLRDKESKNKSLFLVDTESGRMERLLDDVADVRRIGESTAIILCEGNTCLYDFSKKRIIKKFDKEYDYHDGSERFNSGRIHDNSSNVKQLKYTESINNNSSHVSYVRNSHLYVDRNGMLTECPDTTLVFDSFSPGGNYLISNRSGAGAIGEARDTIKLYNAETGNEYVTLVVPKWRALSNERILLFSPDDRYLVYTHDRNKLTIADLSTRRIITRVPNYIEEGSSLFGISKRFVLVYDGQFQLYELKNGKHYMTLPIDTDIEPGAIAFSPDERWLVLGRYLFDITKKECVSDNMSDKDESFTITNSLVTYRDRMVTLPNRRNLYRIIKKAI